MRVRGLGDEVRRKLIAAALAAALPATAHAAAFINGDFEIGPAVGGVGYTTVAGGSTAITGWTVTGNSVDYIGSYWQANTGTHSIDLNGGGQGGIQQTFDTVAGQTYNVSFALAGNPDGLPTTKTVLTTASGGVTQNSTFNAAGTTRTAMGWRNYSYSFTAAGNSTTLSFASADPGAYGAALDSVRVTAVPEPAIWAMMLFGFFGLSFAVRRRDTNTKARVRFT